MSNIEHLIENAIYDLAERTTYEQWVIDEKRRGNITDETEKELKIIWTCAEYVIYTLFTTRNNFRDWVDGGVILSSEEYEDYMEYARNQ